MSAFFGVALVVWCLWRIFRPECLPSDSEVLPEPRVLVQMVWLDGWLGLDEEQRVPVKAIVTKYTPQQREQLEILLSELETATVVKAPRTLINKWR